MNLDPHTYRIFGCLVAAAFIAVGIFVPGLMFAGALKFLRGHPREVEIGRVLAFVLAAVVLVAVFTHRS